MSIILDIDQLPARLGEELAVSPWLEITQARIDAFADATGDRQWLHTDPVRASVESPFGTTIAHGFLTLSVVPMLQREAVQVGGTRLTVNSGVNRVRFIAPVPAGARIRARFAVGAVQAIADGWQVTWQVTVEREGESRPCATIESLTRYYRGSGRPQVAGPEEHA